jgi:hypothetical protein
MHVNPIQFILTVALIAVFFYMQHKKKQAQGPVKKAAPKGPQPAAAPRPPKPARPPEEVYADLRKKAFDVDPGSLGLTVAENEPYASLMEMGLPSTVVTLACFANGDAGLYYQTGGGMTGGGGHEAIRKAAQGFMSVSEKAIPELAPAEGQPLPEPEMVRFYVLTPRGVLTAETHRVDLSDPQSALGALFNAGQEVVTTMRQIQAQRAG